MGHNQLDSLYDLNIILCFVCVVALALHDFLSFAIVVDVDDGKGGLHLKPPRFDRNFNTYLSCRNFFPLSSVQILLIPACCLLCVL